MSSQSYIKKYGHFAVLALVLIGGVALASTPVKPYVNPPNSTPFPQINPPSNNVDVNTFINTGTTDQFKTYNDPTTCIPGNCGSLSVGQFLGMGISHFFGDLNVKSENKIAGGNVDAGFGEGTANLYLTQFADGAKDAQGGPKIDRVCIDQATGKVILCTPVDAQCGSRNGKSYYNDGSTVHGPQWATTTDTLCSKGTASAVSVTSGNTITHSNNQIISWMCNGDYEGMPTVCSATQASYSLPAAPGTVTSNQVITVPGEVSSMVVEASAGGGHYGASGVTPWWCTSNNGGGAGGSGAYAKLSPPMMHNGSRLKSISIRFVNYSGNGNGDIVIYYLYANNDALDEPYLFSGGNGEDAGTGCSSSDNGYGGAGGDFSASVYGSPLQFFGQVLQSSAGTRGGTGYNGGYPGMYTINGSSHGGGERPPQAANIDQPTTAFVNVTWQ